MEMNRKKLQAV